MLGGLLAGGTSGSSGDVIEILEDDGKVASDGAGRVESFASPRSDGVPKPSAQRPVRPEIADKSAGSDACFGAGVPAAMDFAGQSFVPSWNLVNGSRLSVRTSAVDFARHAFPPAAEAEMEALSHGELAELLEFAAAQSAFYLAAGSRRVRHLADAGVELRSLRAENSELKRQVGNLEKAARQFDGKLKLAIAEKMSVEEQVQSLESKVDGLKQENEGLNIQIESLERDATEKEQSFQGKVAELVKVKGDLDWLVREGLVTVVDRVIDLPEFSHGVIHVKNAAFAAGQVAGRAALRAEVKAGGIDEGEASGTSSGVSFMEEALEQFASLDYASLLGLGRLDVDGLRELCRVETAADVGEATQPVGVGKDAADAGKAAGV